MDFKAIVFDAYGTLFDVNSAAEKCKHKIGDKWEAFANFWRTTQLEYTWLRSLMKRHKDFWQITEDSLDKSMNVFNIDKKMKNELLNLYKVLSPYPEVKEVLTDLKVMGGINACKWVDKAVGNKKVCIMDVREINEDAVSLDDFRLETEDKEWE